MQIWMLVSVANDHYHVSSRQKWQEKIGKSFNFQVD